MPEDFNSDKVMPVDILVSGGDQESRDAVSMVVRDALQDQKFANVQTSNPYEGMSMLEAIGKLSPGNKMAGVNITTIGGDTQDFTTAVGKLLRSFDGMDKTEHQKQVDALAAPGSSWSQLSKDILKKHWPKDNVFEQAMEEAAVIGRETYDRSLREAYDRDGPVVALNMANSVIATVAPSYGSIVSMQLTDGTVITAPDESAVDEEELMD